MKSTLTLEKYATVFKAAVLVYCATAVAIATYQPTCPLTIIVILWYAIVINTTPRREAPHMRRSTHGCSTAKVTITCVVNIDTGVCVVAVGIVVV